MPRIGPFGSNLTPSSPETTGTRFEDQIRLTPKPAELPPAEAPSSLSATIRYLARDLLNSNKLLSLIGREKSTFFGLDGVEYKSRQGLNGKIQIQPRNKQETPLTPGQYQQAQGTAKLLKSLAKLAGSKTGVPRPLDAQYADEGRINGLKIERKDGSQTLISIGDPRHQGNSGVDGVTVVNSRAASDPSLQDSATSLHYIYGEHREQMDSNGNVFRVMPDGKAYVRDTKDPQSVYQPVGTALDTPLRADGLRIGEYVDPADQQVKTGVYALSLDGRTVLGISQGNGVRIDLGNRVNDYSVTVEEGRTVASGLLHNPNDKNNASHILLTAELDPRKARPTRFYRDLSLDQPVATPLQMPFKGNVPLERLYTSLAHDIGAAQTVDVENPDAQEPNKNLLLVNLAGKAKIATEAPERWGQLNIDPLALTGSTDTQLKRLVIVHERGLPKLYAQGIGSDPLRDPNSPLRNTMANTDHQLLYARDAQGFGHVPLDVNSMLFMQKDQGLPQPQPIFKSAAQGGLITKDTKGNQTYTDRTNRNDSWIRRVGDEVWQRYNRDSPHGQNTNGKIVTFNDEGARILIMDDPQGGAKGRIWIKRSHHDKYWTPTDLTGYDKLMTDGANYANLFGVGFGQKITGEVCRIDFDNLFGTDTTSTPGNVVTPTRHQITAKETRLIRADPHPPYASDQSTYIPDVVDSAVGTAMQTIAALDRNGNVFVTAPGQAAPVQLSLPVDLNGARLTQVVLDNSNNLYVFAPEHEGKPARVFLYAPSADGSKTWVTHDVPRATAIGTPGTYGQVIIYGQTDDGHPTRQQLLLQSAQSSQSNAQPSLKTIEAFPENMMENIQRNLAKTIGPGELTANITSMGQTKSAPVDSWMNFGKAVVRGATIDMPKAFVQSLMTMPQAAKITYELAQQRKNGYNNLEPLYAEITQDNNTLNQRFDARTNQSHRNTYAPLDPFEGEQALRTAVWQTKESIEVNVLNAIDFLINQDEQLSDLDKSRHYSRVSDGKISAESRRDKNAPNLAKDLIGELQAMINHENRTKIENRMLDLDPDDPSRAQIQRFLNTTADQSFSKNSLAALRDGMQNVPEQAGLLQALDHCLTQGDSKRQQDIQSRIDALEHKHWPRVDTSQRRDAKHLPITMAALSQDINDLNRINDLLHTGQTAAQKTRLIEEVRQRQANPQGLAKQFFNRGVDLVHVEGLNSQQQVLNKAFNDPEWGDVLLKQLTGLKHINPVTRPEILGNIFRSGFIAGRTYSNFSVVTSVSAGGVANIPTPLGVNFRFGLTIGTINFSNLNTSSSYDMKKAEGIQPLGNPRQRSVNVDGTGHHTNFKAGITTLHQPFSAAVDVIKLGLTKKSAAGAVGWHHSSVNTNIYKNLLEGEVTPQKILDRLDYFGENRLGMTREQSSIEIGSSVTARAGYLSNNESKTRQGMRAEFSVSAGYENQSREDNFSNTHQPNYIGKESHSIESINANIDARISAPFHIGNPDGRIASSTNIFSVEATYQNTLNDLRTERYTTTATPLSQNEWDTIAANLEKHFFHNDAPAIQRWKDLYPLMDLSDKNAVGNRSFFEGANDILREIKKTDIYSGGKNHAAIAAIEGIEIRLSQHKNALWGVPVLTGQAFEQRYKNVEIMLHKNPAMKAIYESSGYFRHIVDNVKKTDASFLSSRSRLDRDAELLANATLRGEVVIEPTARQKILELLGPSIYPRHVNLQKKSAASFERISHLTAQPMGVEQMREVADILREHKVQEATQQEILKALNPAQRVFDLVKDPNNGTKRPLYFHANVMTNVQKKNSWPIILPSSRSMTFQNIQPVISVKFSTDHNNNVVGIKEINPSTSPSQLLIQRMSDEWGLGVQATQVPLSRSFRTESPDLQAHPSQDDLGANEGPPNHLRGESSGSTRGSTEFSPEPQGSAQPNRGGNGFVLPPILEDAEELASPGSRASTAPNTPRGNVTPVESRQPTPVESAQETPFVSAQQTPFFTPQGSEPVSPGQQTPNFAGANGQPLFDPEELRSRLQVLADKNTPGHTPASTEPTSTSNSNSVSKGKGPMAPTDAGASSSRSNDTKSTSRLNEAMEPPQSLGLRRRRPFIHDVQPSAQTPPKRWHDDDNLDRYIKRLIDAQRSDFGTQMFGRQTEISPAEASTVKPPTRGRKR